MNLKWKKLPSKTTPQIRAYEEAFKRGKKSQHVIKTAEGWAVKRTDALKASKVFDDKKSAVAYGKKVAKTNHVDLFVHDMQGSIQKSHSY